MKRIVKQERQDVSANWLCDLAVKPFFPRKIVYLMWCVQNFPPINLCLQNKLYTKLDASHSSCYLIAQTDSRGTLSLGRLAPGRGQNQSLVANIVLVPWQIQLRFCVYT